MINQDKWGLLKECMAKLGIQETDFTEHFIIGSGKGGQKLHKTASTVHLKHVPSGLQVKCQDSRSQEENRYFARKRLCEKLQAILTDEKTQAQQAIEKMKRQKKRRTRKSKRKMLDEKSKQGALKVLRKRPEPFM